MNRLFIQKNGRVHKAAGGKVKREMGGVYWENLCTLMHILI